jgi:hypothetical protein
MSIAYGWIISIIGLIWHAIYWWKTESQIISIEAQINQLKNLEPWNIFHILEQTILINTNIDEILSLQKSKFTKIINFFISNKIIYLKLQEYIEILLEILLKLRSDLSIRLAEQKNLLEWAKSELSENIKWETELETVSELQKVRLDKQIEQFEELQKVLVRT